MHLVILTMPEHRFRSVISNAGTDLVIGDEDRLLTMPSSRGSDLASCLMADMISDAVAWLASEGIDYRLLLTDSARAFVFVFESARAANRFQDVWGGDMVEDDDDSEDQIRRAGEKTTDIERPMMN